MELINLSEVTTKAVRWLWQPYIPRGKLTLVQGDPGDGKTTFALAVAAAMTGGIRLPGVDGFARPEAIIVQSAEDGLADTIRPRLEAAGADLRWVRSIDESERQLSLDDWRIEQAILQTKAGLLIIDPIQAYLGAGVDMHRANQVRPMFHHLGDVAERTGCAVLLIGHLNKMTAAKGVYRGLGSIDITAAMRSVLLVGRVRDDENTRAVAQIKSSLAPAGKPVAFSLEGGGLRWIGEYDVTLDELLGERTSARDASKEERAKALLSELLSGGAEMLSATLYERMAAEGIGRRTVENARAALGVVAFKAGRSFRCRMPDDGHEPMPPPEARAPEQGRLPP
jgi:hypothetical protein